MSFDASDLGRFVKDVLDILGAPDVSNAVHLLLGTAAVESAFGVYLRQKYFGPARGIYQMEPDTEKDIWINYLAHHDALERRVRAVTGLSTMPVIGGLQMSGNLVYQTCMARVHYLRVPEQLPPYSDIRAMGEYWKKYWNTHKGKGTVDGFVEAYEKYVCIIG